MNAILKWALQILRQAAETSVDELVSTALALVDIDARQIQVNRQPLESIFSVIGENSSGIVKKNIGWQVLDPQKIVYPTEDENTVSLHIPELDQDWKQLQENENLALVLIEKYGTFLSISTKVPHIAFYDVVKSAAAIHDCLEKGQTKAPFLLVSGDFSGIQEAIYTISSSGALKTLRARSFMLELLTEHIIYEIQKATSSKRYSLIYSGGGGFSLLVPNTDDNWKAINDFVKIINAWMLEQFGFQLFLALHCESLSADAIKDSQFTDTWNLVADKLRKQKQRKFCQNDNFDSLFHPKMPVHLGNQDACQITFRDDLPESEMTRLNEVGRVSKFAYRLWQLGDRLTECESVIRLKKSNDDYRNGTLRFPTYQNEPNCDQYAEYKILAQPSQDNEYDIRWVVNSWNLDNYDEKTYPLLYGDYVRSVADLPDEAQEQEKEEYRNNNEGQEMPDLERITASFSGLAKAAQGSDLIGCLRMDVDNSGDFFSKCTLNLGVGIAASSNLSRSLNLFFKGYLNQICSMNLGAELPGTDYPIDITNEKEHKKTSGRDVSIVYAGGDDLFIVGAWDDVAELAFDINACFKAFTCQNPDVHLSAGVTLHKPKFPLYQMAKVAKQAEDIAKANEWGIGKTKNSLALFYSTELKARNIQLNRRIEAENQKYPSWYQRIDRIALASAWDEYEGVIELIEQLHDIYSEIPHGFYRRLFETLKIWQEDGKLYIPMLERTLRQIEQLQKDIPNSAKLKNQLFEQVRMLHIPLHWVEYLNRQIGGDS